MLRVGTARAPVASWDEAPSDRQDWWRFMGSARKFDDVIVRRMGRDFYRRVFGPALREASRRGLAYEGIRDSIRADWNRRQASTL